MTVARTETQKAKVTPAFEGHDPVAEIDFRSANSGTPSILEWRIDGLERNYDEGLASCSCSCGCGCS